MAAGTLEEVERAHVVRVLALAGGNKKKAAKLLGLPRATLYRKLEKYGLTAAEGPGSAEPPGEAEGPDRLPGRPIGA